MKEILEGDWLQEEELSHVDRVELGEEHQQVMQVRINRLNFRLSFISRKKNSKSGLKLSQKERVMASWKHSGIESTIFKFKMQCIQSTPKKITQVKTHK